MYILSESPHNTLKVQNLNLRSKIFMKIKMFKIKKNIHNGFGFLKIKIKVGGRFTVPLVHV